MIADENVGPQRANVGKKTSGKAQKGRTIEQMYQKKSQLEHILLRPDTYVGSVEKQTQQMWVYDRDANDMVYRPCTFVPGLYKIFDEIVVNAADNKQRDPSMNRIEVDIDPDENTIRVWNNGNGIPIAIHQEHNIYVPELIFGHLLTGSNFDDDEQKTTGGRNGYGAKLANIFSSEFTLETADKSRGLKFKQVFGNNMSQRSEPEISKYSGSDFTCVTFKPDLDRFKMEFMDDDIVALLSKRVFDIAGTNTAAGAKLNVFLNGEKINIHTFQQYIAMFRGLAAPCVFERINERWEVGVAVSDGSFQQVSFVNSICTIKGGQHVNYIVDQVTQKLIGTVKKKNKGQEVKAGHIKNHLAVFVNALVVNPAFDSQTKENLTTKASSFGSTCTLSDKFLKKIETSGVVDNILSWAKFKQNAELKKKGGSKKSKLFGIPKLDDANFAGTAKSRDCTLILTEGDSAKALAISGLGVVGRDYYGVFPLRGKLLNVREAPHAQILKNEEIQNVAKILGLTFGKVYEDTSSLRYGHLMIMTDQDHDGSHIKGLLINFLHHFWPSLLQIDGFLQQFITPIVKCTKGKKEESFFTIPEYMSWKEAHNDAKGWRVKYYKGLGTSTSAEAKEYFSHLGTHEIDFAWHDNAGDIIEMAFSKKRVDDRKQWLLAMEPGVHIDYTVDNITYDSFVNHELILFSHADNQRSLPHFLDGLKPSQRKVLFSCFKRNLKQEIKVAQLAGYVSEHSAYHHGEASLTQTIIGMAQKFVGCGNINLLTPCGQFGTRLMGGKDAASPRYVFTKLEPITRCIFHPDDDALLTYLDDDGQSIEPVSYVPVIPMALVNGSEGIGTGWSTSIPTYNPRDIIHNLRAMLTNDGSEIALQPWYRGFTGEVKPKTGKDSHNYVVSGIIEKVDDSTVVISELPVGKTTTDYKQFLETMLINGADNSSGIIKELKENHTDTTVLFTLTIPPEKLQEIEHENGGLTKKFKIDGSAATTNMHAFDMEGHIKKYDRAENIMEDFFDVRIEYYDKRKNYLAMKLAEEWEKLDNKVRFILAVIHGELVVSNRKKTEILEELKREGYKAFFPSRKNVTDTPDEEVDSQDESDENLDKGYDYLLSMKIWSLTLEKVEELCRERDAKREALDTLLSKSPEDLWMEDLDSLEDALDVFEADIEKEKMEESSARRKAGKAAKGRKGGKKVAVKKKRGFSDDSEDDFDDLDDSDFDAPTKPKVKKTATRQPAKSTANRSNASASSRKTTAVATSKSTSENKPPVEEAPSKPLSLAERLKNKLQKSSSETNSVASNATESQNIVNLCDEEESSSGLNSKPITVAKRSTAPKKKSYNVPDSDEEMEEQFDELSESESEYESDFGAKKKLPAKRAPVSKKQAVTKAKEVSPVKKTEKSKKRPTKASAAPAREAYSPGIQTPPVVKKSRKQTGRNAATDRLLSLAQPQNDVVEDIPKQAKPKASGKVTKKATSKKAAPAAKEKSKPIRKIVLDSDDEDEVEEVFVPKSPKPSRNTRKIVKSYVYDDESEESEFDDDESDFED